MDSHRLHRSRKYCLSAPRSRRLTQKNLSQGSDKEEDAVEWAQVGEVGNKKKDILKLESRSIAGGADLWQDQAETYDADHNASAVPRPGMSNSIEWEYKSRK